MQQRPGRRDQIFYSGKKMAAITGLPTSWLQQNQERQRLGILFYKLVNGDVIRFSIEEVFRWTCRVNVGVVADTP